jgi:L,D-transpeptidase ErfK/SrfK
MRRIIKLLPLATILRLIALFAVMLALNGCATAMKRAHDEAPQPIPKLLKEYSARNAFSLANGDDLIGSSVFMTLEKGDTLADIARHFSLGLNGLSEANPGVDIWAPAAGQRILLPLSFILPDSPRKGIVINLATMRLFHFTENREQLTVSTYPVGVGTEERPSPMGQMSVVRKVSRPTWYVPASIARDHLKKGDPLPKSVPPGPQNPLGEYALYLSAPTYLIHGTNKPASIGLRATNGCIRLYPEDIKQLFGNTPAKTAVNIVQQPYLVGQSNGVVYLEVHGSGEQFDAAGLDTVYAKLKAIEKRAGRPLDWGKVKQALAEARGIPVPVFETRPGSGATIAAPAEIRHPGVLTGKPVLPEMKEDAWYVLAADLVEEIDAIRLAAIINHQGPHIPARVTAKNARYQVVAGPFASLKEAHGIMRRLKIDLDLEGRLIEPVRKAKL